MLPALSEIQIDQDSPTHKLFAWGWNGAHTTSCPLRLASCLTCLCLILPFSLNLPSFCLVSSCPFLSVCSLFVDVFVLCRVHVVCGVLYPTKVLRTARMTSFHTLCISSSRFTALPNESQALVFRAQPSFSPSDSFPSSFRTRSMWVRHVAYGLQTRARTVS